MVVVIALGILGVVFLLITAALEVAEREEGDRGAAILAGLLGGMGLGVITLWALWAVLRW